MKIMKISLNKLKILVFNDGTVDPATRNNSPNVVVLSFSARKSTNLALLVPLEIMTHLNLSNVDNIVAESEIPASSENVRRKKME